MRVDVTGMKSEELHRGLLGPRYITFPCQAYPQGEIMSNCAKGLPTCHIVYGQKSGQLYLV